VRRSVGGWIRIVTAASILVVAGCGSSGLESPGGTIQDEAAEAFLATADASWHRSVDGFGGQTISPEARCYLVADKDGKQFRGTMACGPVRRLGSAPGHVWDLSEVSTVPSGDGAGLQADDNPDRKQSQAVPADGSLWRPDGTEPPSDADSLAEPQVPKASPGMVTVLDQLEVPGLRPVSGQLVNPDTTLTLTGLGSVGYFGQGTTAKAPADGEKFVVARYVNDSTGRWGGPGSSTGTTWTVTVGQTSRPAEDVRPKPEDGGPGSDPKYLVASVPNDAEEVLLSSRNGSVSQSLSLVSGKRTTDTAAAYYRKNTKAEIGKTSQPKSVRNGDYHASYAMTFDDARLLAWDEDKGWAPPGKAWFVLTFAQRVEMPSVYQTKWNPKLFMATADGQPVDTGAIDGDIRLAHRATWAVPAGVRTVRVTAHAAGTFKAPSALFATPVRGSVDFGTFATDVTFG
jgi:hypothetical protein